MSRRADRKDEDTDEQHKRQERQTATDQPTVARPWPDSLLDSGEMGARIRAYDWATTPLGPIEEWPQSLRTVVSTALASPVAMLVSWGRELVMMYNESCSILYAENHPRALGQPFREIWSEAWDLIGPLIEGVLTTATAVSFEDLPVILMRTGAPEETFFAFAYSPIQDESGAVGGVLATVVETTRHILAERRTATLSALAAEHSAMTVEQACDRALAALGANPSDIPFALLYLLDERGETARLAGSVGLPDAAGATHEEPAHPASAATVALANRQGQADGWPFSQAIETQGAVEVNDLEARFGALPGGPWQEPTRAALMLPLASSTRARPAGFLVVGASPRLVLDDAYRQFFTLVAGQVAALIANAQAHEAERQRIAALAALDRAKMTFFANISHEFRTPLTLILAPLEDALADGGNRLAPQHEPLEIAHRNALRLLKLVNSLLDFSRIEAGRAQASFTPTDLAAYTAELASVFRSAIERAGLRLTVDCPPLSAAVGPVYVDREMWEKIVLNLLSNAFKFTFAGEIRVALRASSDGKRVALTVADSGVGVPPEELPHLFERFHRVEGMRARTYEGSGIGLALVRELAQMHGGDVRAESEEGVGTTFTITLPVGAAHLPADHVQARQLHEQARTAAIAAPYVEEALRWLPDTPEAEQGNDVAEESKAEAGGARILLADDNADMRAYLRRLARDEGWQVEAVADGVAALAAARRRAPDLALADVMMPRLDGLGLLRALRADPTLAAVPVILLSARAGEDARLEGLRAGADDYLIKPFAARELTGRIRAQLDLAALRREIAGRERQLEQERAEATAREQTLVETARRMDDFLARASHELRTPLTSIKGNVQMLTRIYPADGATVNPEAAGHAHDALLRADVQIQRLERLVNDLLDVSSIESGAFSLHRAPTDMILLVRGAVAAQQRAHPARAITLELPAGGGPLLVRADVERIAQVVTSYIVNALTYSEADRPVVVSVLPVEATVRVEVRDEGAGVAPEQQQRIWERFARVEDQRHRSGSHIGLGLGLFLGKTIIERHGGVVGVESAPGAGSVFWFALPLARRPEARHKQESASSDV